MRIIITLFLLTFGSVPVEMQVQATEEHAFIEQPHVAIIIDDLGDRFKDGRRVIQLPANLTVGIIPYTPFAKRLASLANKKNKEILLHLPMESVNHKHLGKAGLHSHMTENELLTSLYESLSSVENIRGVSNHMGSQLTQDNKIMQWLMNGLQLHGGLYFVDSRTISTSQAKTVASEVGLEHASRDVFLDHDPKNIHKQWAYMLKLAKQKGSAIAIGHPYPETIAFLKTALPELQQQGVKLVSVSNLIRWRQTRGKLAWQTQKSSSR